MIVPGGALVVASDEGATADLGIARMRVLAAGDATGRSFTLAEFSGKEGAWTVPHLHREMEESFFVLDGRFRFRVGDDDIDAAVGDYVLVPRGVPHVLSAGDGGGRLLTLMVPGGLEDMFFALAALSPDALTDPAARAGVATRFDSLPI